MSNPGLPIRPTKSSPNNKLKPIRMNITVPIQKSIRFFIIMLPAFFALVKPASTIANPACIQNTNAAPIRNHTPNITLLASIIIASFIIHYRFIFFPINSGISPRSFGVPKRDFLFFFKSSFLAFHKLLSGHIMKAAS